VLTVREDRELLTVAVSKPASSDEFNESIKSLYLGRYPEKAYPAIQIFLFLFFVLSSNFVRVKELKVRVRSRLPVGMGLGSSGSKFPFKLTSFKLHMLSV
jgi:homoserine kinase